MPRKSASAGTKSSSKIEPSIITTDAPERKSKRDETSARSKGRKPLESAIVPDQRKIEDLEKTPVSEEIGHVAQSDSPNKSRIVNLRVPVQIVEDIDYWVSNGRYRSRSEFLLAATRYYLDYIEYRESYNTRTFQRGQMDETPAERIDRLRYLRGAP